MAESGDLRKTTSKKREEREAEALRENLRKRKEQQRVRKQENEAKTRQ